MADLQNLEIGKQYEEEVQTKNRENYSGSDKKIIPEKQHKKEEMMEQEMCIRNAEKQ